MIDFKNNKIIDSFLQKKRFPHAIMIESPDDEIAERQINFIIQFILCSSEEHKPCGKCRDCMKAESFMHPDVEFIKPSGASNSLNVDTIRNVRETAYILPNEAEYKIYVFYNADNMNVSAQNAFLKILEEPPRRTIFILSVKSSTSLLETIRSRVSIFTLDADSKSNISDQALELVEKISNAIVSSREYDVLVLEPKLIKDKFLFKDVVLGLLESMRCSYRYAFGIGDQSVISKSLTVEQIMRIIKELNQTLVLIERNVNQTLLVTTLFSKIRMIVFS